MDVLILLLPLLLLVFLISRTRRQQRSLFEAQAAAVPGAEVLTTAGLYARVVEVDGDVVVLETAPGQQARWARQVIARVLVPAPADQDAGTGAETSPTPDRDPAPPKDGGTA